MKNNNRERGDYLLPSNMTLENSNCTNFVSWFTADSKLPNTKIRILTSLQIFTLLVCFSLKSYTILITYKNTNGLRQAEVRNHKVEIFCFNYLLFRKCMICVVVKMSLIEGLIVS